MTLHTQRQLRKEQQYGIQSEINIYRIIQEIVNNAVKHANAKEITSSVKGGDELSEVDVTDAGNGFNVLESSPGFGLKNIATRVRFNDGNYKLSSALGIETQFHLTFEKKKLV